MRKLEGSAVRLGIFANPGVLLRAGAVALALAALAAPGESAAQSGALQIKSRHVDVSRKEATAQPRSEGDQAMVDGWPLYRTERSQEAFNDAMATLKATDFAAPSLKLFKGCTGLDCELLLPPISEDGWLAAGRLWVSPTQYVLIVHSHRNRDGRPYRRHAFSSMRYFVLHEFLNSTRNTDTYDTISSHSSSVFVPFYMSKQATDARGRHLVIIVQVAPYDVVSVHASDKGSSGPGVEVAKNYADALEPLQAQAGILLATMIKTAAPHLKVVNHRGTEGLPMLNAYERRLETLRAQSAMPRVALPFVPAHPDRVSSAVARFEDLIAERSGSARIPVAARGIVPLQSAALMPALRASAEPTLVVPIRRAQRPAPPAEPVLVEPLRPLARPADQR